MPRSVAHCVEYCSKGGGYYPFGVPVPHARGKASVLDGILEWGDRFIEDNGRAPTRREMAVHNSKSLISFRNVYETFLLRAPAPKL